MAASSLVIGIVSLFCLFILIIPPVIGLILGILGLQQIQRRERSGLTMAVLGIALNSVLCLLGAVLLLSTVFSDDEDTETAADPPAAASPASAPEEEEEEDEPEEEEEDEPEEEEPEEEEPEEESTVSFGNGIHLVGEDIEPGQYRTDGPHPDDLLPMCYWARLSDTSGEFEAIIANDNIEGPGVVTISDSDAAFEASGGCEWVLDD